MQTIQTGRQSLLTATRFFYLARPADDNGPIGPVKRNNPDEKKDPSKDSEGLPLPLPPIGDASNTSLKALQH